MLDERAAALLDEEVGDRPAGYRFNSSTPNVDDAVTWKLGATRGERGYKDEGGPSRFMYTAKASASERKLPDGTRHNHPTTKPVSLMRWLVRLVTPPNGIVLDPFCGSGSTGVAALQEGFRFVGIDLTPDYCEIARTRLAAAEMEKVPA